MEVWVSKVIENVIEDGVEKDTGWVL